MTVEDTGAAGRWAVKVRASASHWWTSPWLTEDDARGTARKFRDDIRAMSDGPSFVTFRANGGREVNIRARDIVAVELVPWHERSTQPMQAGGQVVPLPAPAGLPRTGTEWLRRQADAEQVSAR